MSKATRDTVSEISNREQFSVAAGIVLFQPDTAILEKLLTTLKEDGVPLFLFVNDTLDPGSEALLAGLENVWISRSIENVGLGAGLNAVTEAAFAEGFKGILLFDQDSTPAPGFGMALGESARRCAATYRFPIAAIGPRLVAPPGEPYLEPRHSRRYSSARSFLGGVDFLSTSGTLVSREGWVAAGPFRADYFIDGIDVEWCFRAWKNNFAVVLAEDVSMVHRWGTASGEGQTRFQILRQSPLRSFYYLRNATYGLRLAHMPRLWRLRSAGMLILQAALLLIDRRPGRMPATMLITAFADGWKGRLGRFVPLHLR